MQRQVFLVTAVTFMVFGQIISSPIPVPQPSLQTAPCKCTSSELEVDSTTPELGDIPITHNNNIEILNRQYVPLKNCKEILDYNPQSKSGLYTVQPGDGGEFVVYCDMALLGGGWTIIQRRLNSHLSFNRSYSSYQNGFGDYTENFWLGLDKINRLATHSDAPMEVYFGMQAFFGFSSSSHYANFTVEGKDNGYKLRIDGFKGHSNADYMSRFNGQNFSTYDKDQDMDRSDHCKETFRGFSSGWWFKDCEYSNPNGIYYEQGSNTNVNNGISWRTWLGSTYSLKTMVIAIKPATS